MNGGAAGKVENVARWIRTHQNNDPAFSMVEPARPVLDSALSPTGNFLAGMLNDQEVCFSLLTVHSPIDARARSTSASRACTRSLSKSGLASWARFRSRRA